MLLSEISNANHVKKNGMFSAIMRSWEGELKSGAKYSVEGKIGQFEIRVIQAKVHWFKTLYVALFDTTQNRYAAAADLDQFGRNARSWQAAEVGVDSQYQGMNLAVKLYTWIITKKNLILLSGMSQSPGGKAIWERLSFVPGIFIFGYNVDTKESFQIDQKDLFNEDIYGDELAKEHDELQNEYSSLEMKLEQLSDKNNTSVRKVSKMYPDIVKKMNEINHKLTTLQKAINKADDYLRLVAIKKH